MVEPSSPVTLTVTVLAPALHDAVSSLSISTPLTLISNVASALVGVAVTLFEAFVVVVVYVNVSASNVGDKVSDPIVSPERVLLMGLHQASRKL